MAKKKIILRLLLVCALVTLPVSTEKQVLHLLVSWNVGQGQWSTLVYGSEECWHFDAGGEFMNWQALQALCSSRRHRIFLSHWDQDHIQFVPRLARHFDTCLDSLPPISEVKPPSRKKQRQLAKMRLCEAQPQDLWHWRPDAGLRRTNDLSQIYSSGSALFPGDSPKSQEKIWLQKLPSTHRVRILLLGHHGSRTATSRELMEKLSHLRMAIASSRRARYGHPHREVVELLQTHRIPLLRTEDWGTIGLAL